VALTSGIKVLQTPHRTRAEHMPSANAFWEASGEHVWTTSLFYEKQLCRLLMMYVVYFNQARLHQGIQQQIPTRLVLSAPPTNQLNPLIAALVLGVTP